MKASRFLISPTRLFKAKPVEDRPRPKPGATRYPNFSDSSTVAVRGAVEAYIAIPQKEVALDRRPEALYPWAHGASGGQAGNQISLAHLFQPSVRKCVEELSLLVVFVAPSHRRGLAEPFWYRRRPGEPASAADRANPCACIHSRLPNVNRAIDSASTADGQAAR
jgi:hypothetical protein